MSAEEAHIEMQRIRSVRAQKQKLFEAAEAKRLTPRPTAEGGLEKVLSGTLARIPSMSPPSSASVSIPRRDSPIKNPAAVMPEYDCMLLDLYCPG